MVLKTKQDKDKVRADGSEQILLVLNYVSTYLSCDIMFAVPHCYRQYIALCMLHIETVDLDSWFSLKDDTQKLFP